LLFKASFRYILKKPSRKQKRGALKLDKRGDCSICRTLDSHEAKRNVVGLEAHGGGTCHGRKERERRAEMEQKKKKSYPALPLPAFFI
jgi:hypothetical protein